MTSTRLFVPFLFIPLLSACGSSPSAPSATPAAEPASTAAPVFIDGWTGQVITASIAPGPAATSSPVTITAPGYLPREQRLDGRPVALWPAADAYVQELVYGWDFTDGAPRLVRWEAGFTVTLEGELAGDAEVVARVDSVLNELRRATGLPIVLGPFGAVTLAVDPAGVMAGALADTQIVVRGGSMVSARMRFPSRAEVLGSREARYGNTLLHELGHAAGLSHSADSGDVMTPADGRGRQLSTYAENELIALRMMYVHRRPGNLPIDRDPGPTAASSRTETIRVVD